MHLLETWGKLHTLHLAFSCIGCMTDFTACNYSVGVLVLYVNAYLVPQLHSNMLHMYLLYAMHVYVQHHAQSGVLVPMHTGCVQVDKECT